MIKDKMVKIYCYTNKINGKKYIGQTNGTLISRSGRFGNKYATSTKFFNAILRYGWGNFEPNILEIAMPEFADERERYWIKHFDTVKNGYNITTGGRDGSNFRIPVRKRKHPKTFNQVSAFKGKHHTDKTKKELSEKAKKRLAEKGHPLKGKTGELAPMWGKHHSEQTKNIMSIKHSGKNNPMYGKPPTNKGKHHTQEAKEKTKLSKSYIVYLTNIKTGEKFAFIGAKDASKFVNKSECRINQCAKVNGVVNGYMISYGGKYKDHKEEMEVEDDKSRKITSEQCQNRGNTANLS